MGWALRPIFSTYRTTASICSGRAPASMTTSMAASIIEHFYRPFRGERMRKILSFVAVAFVITLPAFASYWVVLRDGTKYKAKAKPEVVNGRAIIQLESGTTIAVDPASIDQPRSDQVTKMGGADPIEI